MCGKLRPRGLGPFGVPRPLGRRFPLHNVPFDNTLFRREKRERKKRVGLDCSVVRYPSCDTTTRNWEKEKEDKQSTAAMAAFAKAILPLLFSPSSSNRGWLALCALVENSRLPDDPPPKLLY